MGDVRWEAVNCKRIEMYKSLHVYLENGKSTWKSHGILFPILCGNPVTGEQNIAEHWKTHYDNIFHCN